MDRKPTDVERGGLLRHSGFVKLWIAQTISVFGSQITSVALPLTAVLTLGATPAQMGFLRATEYAPAIFIGLFAGVWVDRLRRRPILISSDLARAVLLGSVPLCALLGVLSMGYLYVVAFLVGTLTAFFDVAYFSYLPTLVGRERLVEGNSKLEASRSVAMIGGPGAGGVLVQVLTAPIAIALDALSFVLSAVLLGVVRGPEPQPSRREEGNTVWSDISEGMRFVSNDSRLRAAAGSSATLNLFVGMILTVFVLFLARDLDLGPAFIGIIIAAFGPGALAGALLTTRITRRLGLATASVGAVLLAGVAGLFVPLSAALPFVAAVSILIVAQFLIGFTGPIYSINMVSLRQTITPDHLLGRVNATLRVVTLSMLPVGSLLGGGLGEAIGLSTTLAVGAVGVLLASLWLLLSPIRSLRELPA